MSDITYDKLTHQPSRSLREYCSVVGLDEPTMGNRFAWIDYNCDAKEELHFLPAARSVSSKQLPYLSVGNSFIVLVLGPDSSEQSHWNVIFQFETLQVETKFCVASIHLSRLKPLNICDVNVGRSIAQSLVEFAHNPFSLEEFKHLVVKPFDTAPTIVASSNPPAAELGTINVRVANQAVPVVVAKSVGTTPSFGAKPVGTSNLHSSPANQRTTGFGTKPTASCQVVYGTTGSTGYGATPVGATGGYGAQSQSRTTGFGAKPTSSTGFGGFGPSPGFSAKSTGFGSSHNTGFGCSHHGGFGSSSHTGFGSRA